MDGGRKTPGAGFYYALKAHAGNLRPYAGSSYSDVYMAVSMLLIRDRIRIQCSFSNFATSWRFTRMI
jgi:hypothetical protein